MILILVSYIMIVVQWVTLYFVHRQAPAEWPKAKRATWWLLGASVIVGIALVLNLLWLSFIGMLFALTAVAFVFQVLTQWMRAKKVSPIGVLVWYEWALVICLTFAHLFVMAFNYLHETAN